MPAPHQPPAAGCPDEEALILHAHGRRDELLEHVRGCPACAEIVAGVRLEAGFADDVRRALASAREQRASGGSGTRSAGSPPARIAGFTDVTELSRGGQGVIYRATQEHTNRPVAIKLLLAGSLATPRERFRFEREIEIASMLHHPNILTVYGALTLDDERLGYVMEFVEGETIDAWAAELPAGQASRRRVVALFVKVARAVQYAHARGVIHRDLKPGNILVNPEGEPRVLDFGLARRSRGEGRGDEVTLTLAGEFAGTPEYASPEQIEHGTEATDARSDVYTLGVILYRLLCGSPPYDTSGGVREIFDTICTRPARDPAEAAAQAGLPALDKDIATVVLRSLAKDKERRYQSAGALADDLEQWLKGEAVGARRDSAWYVLRMQLRKHRREALVLAGAAALLLSAAGVAIVMGLRANAAGEREALRRRQRDEETLRAQAVSLVMSSVVPQSRAGAASATPDPLDARVTAGLTSLSSALDAGWLADNPALAAQVQDVLADIHALRGTQSGWLAEASARRAATLVRGLHGSDDIRTLHAEFTVASAMVMRGRAKDAEVAALQLRDRLATHPESSPEDRAKAAALLGRALLMQQRWEDALAALRVGRRDLSSSLASRLGVLEARALHGLGREQDARAALRGCLRDVLAATRDTDPAFVEALRLAAELGVVDGFAHRELAQTADALESALGDDHGPLCERSATLVGCKGALTGDTSSEVAESMALAADAHMHAKKFFAAAEWYERAAGLLQGTPEARATLYQKAAVMHASLFRHEDAARCSVASLSILRSLGEAKTDPYFIASAERDVAIRLTGAKRFAEAERSARAAVEAFEALLGRTGHVVAYSYAVLAAAQFGRGDTAGGSSSAQIALALSGQSTSMPPDQRLLTHFVASVWMIRTGQHGKVPDLLRDAEEHLRTASYAEASRAYFASVVHGLRACASERMGDARRSAAEREQARSAFSQCVGTLSAMDGHAEAIDKPWELPPFACAER
jgi:tetratricopeptide (TPR) repeat protein